VLSLERAMHQDIRELHIGFLNMMPDAALEATERQFIRLVGGCNRIAQFFVYPFSLPGLARGAATLEYIERYYSKFADLQESGLDAALWEAAVSSAEQAVSLAQIDDVTIYVFMYPVIRPELSDHSRSVWCSPDRSKAWLDLALRKQLPTAAPSCSRSIPSTTPSSSACRAASRGASKAAGCNRSC